MSPPSFDVAGIFEVSNPVTRKTERGHHASPGIQDDDGGAHQRQQQQQWNNFLASILDAWTRDTKI
jgi:hypothetical protein